MTLFKIIGRIASITFKTNSQTAIRNMSSPSKLMKPTKYIGTHDGTFHCDDVTACFMLKQLDRFRDHDIVRSRDPEVLAKADIVVDVGGELDIEKLRLDHHQRTFQQTIKDYHPNLKSTNPEKPVRLSSSGLVYAIFGKEFIIKLLELGTSYDELDEEKRRMVDAIYAKAYTEFFEEIDAIDNGVDIASGDNVVYNYHINSGISSRVGYMNPSDKNASAEKRLEQFHASMKLVGDEICEGIRFLGQHWWPKRQQFRQYMLKREEFDPSGQMILLDLDNLLGWKSSVLDLEEELGIVGQIKFIIYKDDQASQSPWRATGVPPNLKSFALRVPFKEDWRGKRDEDLQQVSGVKDAVFVHMSGFTGGAKSLEGIKSLVRQTLGLE